MKTQGGGRDCTVSLGSITQAQKAQSALAEAAIPSAVIKLSKSEASSSRRGCVYGLRFSCAQQKNVSTVLDHARISVKQWYREE